MSDIDAMKFFRALDKRDRVGIGGVFELLTDGRKDQSGDFTEGVGLSPEKAGCVIVYYQPWLTKAVKRTYPLEPRTRKYQSGCPGDSHSRA